MLRLDGLRTLRKHMEFEAADRAVGEASKRLQQGLAPGHWVGRVSEDEFLIVSVDCNSPSCAKNGSSASQLSLRPLEINTLACDLRLMPESPC